MGHIYGPYAVGWTASQFEFVADGRLMRVEEWRNPSNTVFVDNAVEAIVSAMMAADVAGKTFYITDYPNQSWREFYEPLFRVAGRDMDVLPNLTFDEFFAIFREYTRGPLKQGAEIVGSLGGQMFRRDLLKQIKNSPRFTRFFDALQAAVPAPLFGAVMNTLKNRAPADAKESTNVSSIFSYLCSYASSVELPVRDAVEALGYRAPHVRSEAGDAAASWLRFVQNR